MKEKIISKVINYQFQIIGEKVKFEDIVEGIKIGKKIIQWYNYYFYDNENQYQEWRRWARIELEKEGLEMKLDEIDMLYGLHCRFKKKEELF